MINTKITVPSSFATFYRLTPIHWIPKISSLIYRISINAYVLFAWTSSFHPNGEKEFPRQNRIFKATLLSVPSFFYAYWNYYVNSENNPLLNVLGTNLLIMFLYGFLVYCLVDGKNFDEKRKNAKKDSIYFFTTFLTFSFIFSGMVSHLITQSSPFLLRP